MTNFKEVHGYILSEGTVEDVERAVRRYQELHNAFQHFNRGVTQDCVNDLDAVKLYPFDKSFDELVCEVEEWTESAIKELFKVRQEFYEKQSQ